MLARTIKACVLTSAALGLLACQAQGPAGLTDADKSAIRQAADAFEKASNAKNFDAGATYWAEDATLGPPNGELLQGRQSIRKWLDTFPPFSDFKLQLVDVDGRGDLAYVRGTYSMTITAPGAAPVNDRGKYLEVWRKQSDGAWKVTRDLFNSDLPAAAPAPK